MNIQRNLKLSKKPKKKIEPKKLYCPQCGSEVSPEDEFCECGKLLLLDEDYDAITDEED
jgi:predicted amidophosphoribosyltransferase